MLTVSLTRLPHSEGLPLPAYATPRSAGMDLLAAVDGPVRIAAGGWALVPTGIAIALPPGYEAQVRPRSGLALKHGLTVLNSPGTIDEDYRGEIKVILANIHVEDYVVERGARIAQLVVAPVTRIQWAEAKVLEETARAAGGFGSTGVH